MKKRILGLILAVIACLTLCIPAIAAEIESDDYGTIPMVDVDSSTENNSMDELNDAGESYPNIEQLNEIYNDSDSTMLDFICVTNPELFSELTDCDYKNDVLVYGNDPSGEFFAFNFSNRDTSPNYGS